MITVGIPFYNDAQYLDLAIRSVLNQTYADWKLILIDDGGTDGSLAIARQYENNPRVTVVSDGTNKKLPARLNQMINMTETKYFARMDADDIMHPERLAIQLAILEQNPDIDVLGTNAYTIDGDNNLTGVRQPISDELISVNGFIHPTVMAKTAWYKEHQYDVDAIRIEDVVLWLCSRKSSVYKITLLPLLFYREIGTNYYKKYNTGANTALKVGLQNKWSVKSRIYFFKRFFTHKFKAMVYYLAAVAGREAYLLKHRNRGVLTVEGKIEAAQVLFLFTKHTV